MAIGTDGRPLYALGITDDRTFRDFEGNIAWVQGNLEVLTKSLDWSNRMGETETISTYVATGDGVTVSATSISGQTTLFTVTGNNGHVDHKITTSTGRTLTEITSVYAPENEGGSEAYHP